MEPAPSPTRERVKIGRLWIDRVTFAEALDTVEYMVRAGRGGSVFTPNVDHVVVAETHAAFQAAYDAVDLSLVDGMPLLWAAQLLDIPLPEKISGSDLMLPLLRRASARGWRVYLFGGAPGVAEKAAEIIAKEDRVMIVGTDAPRVEKDGSCEKSAIEKIQQAKPDLVLTALGAPKQELWIHRHAQQLCPAVALGIGAGLDFVAGTVKRAPKWMSDTGLEWFYRLSHEPKRLWRRYLVNDPKFLAIFLRQLRTAKEERVKTIHFAGFAETSITEKE